MFGTKKKQEDKQKQNNGKVTVHPGGMEGSGVSIEQPKVESGGGVSFENLRQPEKGQERAGETRGNIESEKAASAKRAPVQPSNYIPAQSQASQASQKLKLFGYKIPPALANNPKKVSKKAGKGDPKKSMSWLLLALDRMFKMQTAT